MYVVAVGALSGDPEERIRAAIQRAGGEPGLFWDAEDAKASLGDDARPIPRCILIDAATIDGAAFVTWLRHQPRLFPVPAVILVPDIHEAAFQTLHNYGADDALSVDDAAGVTRRLLRLAEFDPAERPPPDRGTAVIAHADWARRTVLGRILRIAGFDVAFAGRAEDVPGVVQQRGGAALLVVHDDLLAPSVEGIASALALIRDKYTVPTIVLGLGANLPSLQRATSSLGSVLVERELAPPDNLAFLANELLLPSLKNKRESARLLRATLCSFRPRGTLHPTFGVTYNLSGGGLYVRTLATPAPRSGVWVELTPPDQAEEVVHLRGTVMWCQKMNNRRASPPGFGINFDHDATPRQDMVRYLEAYRACT